MPLASRGAWGSPCVGMEADADYLAFKELLRRAESDPALLDEIERLMREGAPLAEVLALLPRH